MNNQRRIPFYVIILNPWITITNITIIIVFALTNLLVFAREAFGHLKTRNFVSKNSARIQNFLSRHSREAIDSSGQSLGTLL